MPFITRLTDVGVNIIMDNLVGGLVLVESALGMDFLYEMQLAETASDFTNQWR